MINSLNILLAASLAGLSSAHPCLTQVGRDSAVCQQLISLCSSSSQDLPSSCSSLTNLLDSQTEEQRIDLGLAVLEPSIGTLQITTAAINITILFIFFYRVLRNRINKTE